MGEGGLWRGGGPSPKPPLQIRGRMCVATFHANSSALREVLQVNANQGAATSHREAKRPQQLRNCHSLNRHLIPDAD
jgi:hypothetical protein